MLLPNGAARGAARFDQLRPGWASAIDPSTVDVRSLTTCPTAQVFGTFDAALRELGIRDGDQDAIVELGLDVHLTSSSPSGYAQLSAAWRREIERRVNRR